MEENPYKPPESKLIEIQIEQEYCLASRWKRLIASIIDSIVILIVVIPTVYLTSGYIESTTRMSNFFYDLGIGVIGITTFALVNGKMLVHSGQTIGKRIIQLYIVDRDTEEVPEKKNLFTRYIIYLFAPYLPFIGGLASFINIVVIFGKSRECVHDYFAKTKVVEIIR